MSEIRVDTISEKTSANGVAVDGVTLKDGGLSATGSVVLQGTSTAAEHKATWVATNNSLDFGDSTQLRFGASADMKIYHDGTNSYINDAGTGNLKIGAADLQLMNAANSELMIQGIQDGAVTLYHNNIAKLATAAGGVTITGDAGATTFNGIPFHLNNDDDSSSIYTHDVSGTDNLARGNTAYGIAALDAITTGDGNTAIGNGSLTGNNTGVENTAIGKAAMNVSTSASYNVAIGNSAGAAMTTGDLYNTLVGHSAGASITSGNRNVFIGTSAGDGHDTETHNLGMGVASLGGSIAGGEYNVAIGNYTLDALTSGDNNVAIGYHAGGSMTDGGNATLIGFEAGKALQGNDLTAVGYKAGTATTAGNNTFIGVNAGLINAGGDSNIGIGKDAYDNADAENHNLAIGRNALGGAVNGGEFNVAIGNNTLDALTSGDKNTVVGYDAGTVLTTGANNTAMGHKAADELTEGNANTAIGDEALTNLTTGTGNSALGAVAGDNLTTGGQSLFLGQDTKASAGGGTYQFVIGHNVTSAGNSTTTIGYDTTEIATNHGSASWAAVSDERYKKDITNSTAGLSFIDDLRTVTFKFKQKNELATDIYGYDANSTDTDGYTDEIAHGFIAQEIKAVLDNHPEIKAGQEIWKQSTDEKSNRQSVSHIGMIPMLVKAIQELSAKVKALEEA